MAGITPQDSGEAHNRSVYHYEVEVHIWDDIGVSGAPSLRYGDQLQYSETATIGARSKLERSNRKSNLPECYIDVSEALKQVL